MVPIYFLWEIPMIPVYWAAYLACHKFSHGHVSAGFLPTRRFELDYRQNAAHKCLKLTRLVDLPAGSSSKVLYWTSILLDEKLDGVCTRNILWISVCHCILLSFPIFWKSSSI